MYIVLLINKIFKKLLKKLLKTCLSPCMLECSKYALVMPAKSALSFIISLQLSSSIISSSTSLFLSGTILNLINIEYRCSKAPLRRSGSACWLENWPPLVAPKYQEGLAVRYSNQDTTLTVTRVKTIVAFQLSCVING